MDKETFIKFEKSAKLELSENEREDTLITVNGLLERFGSVAGYDTEGVKPLISILENQRNVLREDMARKLIDREELLERAPETYEGCFVVPKTVD